MPELEWHVFETDALMWRDLDDGCLVYHRLTGETHFFNLYTAFILRTLQEQPRSLGDLCHHVATQLDELEDDAFVEKISQQLANFESMAMIGVREK